MNRSLALKLVTIFVVTLAIIWALTRFVPGLFSLGRSLTNPSHRSEAFVEAEAAVSVTGEDVEDFRERVEAFGRKLSDTNRSIQSNARDMNTLVTEWDGIAKDYERLDSACADVSGLESEIARLESELAITVAALKDVGNSGGQIKTRANNALRRVRGGLAAPDPLGLR